MGSTVTYKDDSDYSGGIARRRRSAANAFTIGPIIPDPRQSNDIGKYGLLGALNTNFLPKLKFLLL